MTETRAGFSGAQGLYYSSYHLAKDFFWNVGASVPFFALALIIDPCFCATFTQVLEYLVHLNSDSLEIAAGIAFLSLAAVAGVIAPKIFKLLFFWLKRTKVNYETWYAEDARELRRLLGHVLGAPKDACGRETKQLTIRGEPRPMDYLLGLTTYCRIYNPAGYAHVYREYTKVNLYRQACVYSLFLAAWQLWSGQEWTVVVLLLALAFLWIVPLHSAVRSAVSREYSFITATLQWLSYAPSEK